MAETLLDNQALMKRTLVTAGAMVGGCVTVVGTLTLVAVAIVGRAVSPAQGEAASDGGHPALVTPQSKATISPPSPVSGTRPVK
jgi:hypothetical protein